MQWRKSISLAPPGVSRVKVGGGVGTDRAGRGGGVWGQREIGFPGWEGSKRVFATGRENVHEPEWKVSKAQTGKSLDFEGRSWHQHPKCRS